MLMPRSNAMVRLLMPWRTACTMRHSAGVSTSSCWGRPRRREVGAVRLMWVGSYAGGLAIFPPPWLLPLDHISSSLAITPAQAEAAVPESKLHSSTPNGYAATGRKAICSISGTNGSGAGKGSGVRHHGCQSCTKDREGVACDLAVTPFTARCALVLLQTSTAV